MWGTRNVLEAVETVLAVLAFAGIALAGGGSTQTASPVMEKFVSKEANFVLYKPRGWTVNEGAQPTFRTISVTDPAGQYEAAMSFGTSPTGGDMVALARMLISGIARQFPDLEIPGAAISSDRGRIVFDAAFTAPQQGRRELRCWIAGGPGGFVCSSIDAPVGQLAAARPLLLTILSNVRIMKGAMPAGDGAAPIQVTWSAYRLSDGSASFRIPQGWGVREFGRGCFTASDPSGTYSFMVASVDAITPQLGVTYPGAVISPYLPPSRALPFFGGRAGLMSNMQIMNLFPRPDVARQMAQVYTAGPLTAEEFVYTCDTRRGKAKGYTFGVSFGSRLGTNWSLRHLSVFAPAGTFDRYLGNFVTMLQSYQVDDQWARQYVAQGMARLRQMQQQTSAMVSRNAQEIHQMMQDAYNERQTSQDYIDYQRTNYIRGQQDWISTMEGGSVYHTDTWGTKNLTTGETWNGQPYNYVHFEGQNPKYNEQMQSIDSRALWERYRP